jgi:hypothetical protein
MSPKGASGVGTGASDLERGMIDEQARETTKIVNASKKTGLFFAALG